MGCYLGIRRDGELVAMAGERFPRRVDRDQRDLHGAPSTRARCTRPV